jgi:hypothetical protein
MSGTVVRPKQPSVQVFCHSYACRWVLYVWGRVKTIQLDHFEWPPERCRFSQRNYKIAINCVWNTGCLVQTWKYVLFVPCISYVSVQSVWTANVIKVTTSGRRLALHHPARPCRLTRARRDGSSC